MNTAEVKTVKMFGPALSGPARLVNRDVPVCDEQAYKAAGYKRGSIPEASEQPEQPKALVPGTEEVALDEPEAAPVAEAQPKPRRRKAQN